MVGISNELIDRLYHLPEIDTMRKDWSYYTYGDIAIPRVTMMLDNCISKSYLANWAASLGSVQAYKEAKFAALDTGSYAHELIEDYLSEGYIKDNYTVGKYTNKLEAMNAFNNYKYFEQDLLSKGYDIESLMLELQCCGPLYGGTIDFVANIVNNNTLDSKMYILDFKTSRKISMEYLLQTMLYVININYLKSIGIEFYKPFNIGGIGIIRIDKQRSGVYQYLFVDFEQDKEFADKIAETALSLVEWYYNIMSYDYVHRNMSKQLMNREELF